MTILECQIHKCRFGIEAPDDADQKMRAECSWSSCPLCERAEREAMSTELVRLRNQNRQLILAIEIKQEHLRVEIK